MAPLKDGQKKWIKQRCKEIRAEEQRQFMLAYAHLDSRYHGYMQEIPQRIKIRNEGIDKTDLAELQKEFPNLAQWGTPPSLFYSSCQPYLGIDGYLAVANDDAADKKEKLSFEVRIIETETATKKLLIEAKVSTPDWISMGIAEVKKKKDNTFENIEIASSAAIRKALHNKYASGRWPIHTTPYGEDPVLEAYRDFVKEHKNGPKKDAGNKK